ncbi:hypothetical protein SODG_005770 [Sodalis praecaptivus]|uniref:glycosyltransferase family 9 protein n=1 Tax=Sodalis praecaptivus TaxID=1239307 RepID=UPI0027F280CA|nr:glycosyltransferase family 9 protein [Sodalis praecaptivus]CAJ0997671.1 hypothetical protein NVIRENTERO_02958 [Sodalis praecaptivus]
MYTLRDINRGKNAALRQLKFNALNAWLNLTCRPQPWALDKIKRILLLRLDDKIGDMVITTGTARQLADNGYHISVLTGPACQTLLACCDAVHQTYRYDKRMSLTVLRQQRFDVIIDFDDVANYERLRLLHHLAPRYVIGFNKPGSARYAPQLAWRDSERHITERHRAVLALFNLPPAPFLYSLGRDPSAVAALAPYLSRPANEWLIAINPFTGAEDKDFSREQVEGLIAHLRRRGVRFRVLLIGRGDLLSRWRIDDAAFVADSTINTAVEIVRSADLVVSPDTSIVHMACAFNTPLVAVYNTRRLKDNGLVGYNIWAPHYDNAVQLVIDRPAVRELPLETLLSAVDEKLADMTRLRASSTTVAMGD